MSKLPTLFEFASLFQAKVVGDSDLKIKSLAPLDKAGPGDLAFLANPIYRNQATQSQASALIVNQADYDFLTEAITATGLPPKSFLIAKNPYALFARIGQFFAKSIEPQFKPGIHPSAYVDPSVQVPDSCYVGPMCVIEAGVVLGDSVVLESHVHLSSGVHVGASSKIKPMVSIYYNCQIGERAIIHSGCVIGSDGFGFAPDFTASGGEWVKIPQVGRVVIGNDVEIGANTAIDRGAMADTVIEDGCKIDNQVQIAHNVRVGAFTVIAGCAAIAGSTVIGKLCVIGGSANFAGHLQIADRTTVSGGTSITRSIKEPGQHFTSVFPFSTHAEWEKNAAIVRGLDKIRQRIRALEQLQKN
jgi:UDP-3-O-[3-hydroxymyristoyl] glucosamine N-acyltransferase